MFTDALTHVVTIREDMDFIFMLLTESLHRLLGAVASASPRGSAHVEVFTVAVGAVEDVSAVSTVGEEVSVVL